MALVAATLIPLVAFVIQVSIGRRLGRGAALVATAAIGLSFCLSAIRLSQFVMFEHPGALSAHVTAGHAQLPHATGEHAAHPSDAHAHSQAHKNTVVEKGSFVWATLAPSAPDAPAGSVRLGYRIDSLTVLMFFMITLVATCVHIYSIGYMGHEVRFHRFFTYLSLFCFSMLALVIADNFFQVFVCWELVGVCSYLLIGFYYEKRSASNAANKAFITNRVGDVGFLVGLMILYAHWGVFGFDELFGSEGILQAKWVSQISPFWLTVAGIGIFVGCVGKSAQFPLHVWLPDAMEGPTPVSALIHAATMVAAGVYLVARAFPLFSHEALLVIAYTGGITLFVAATIAIVATDIKKALAYSTVSQLGYMMLALGIGGWVAGLMHLITHAFFKALLFLCSGSVIHGTGTQEMPQMGGLHKKMPITSWTMLIGVLAIAGCPFFSGFYSKDAMIAYILAFGESNASHAFLLALPVVTAGVTAFYMFRLWFLTFAGSPRDAHVHDHAHESPPSMWVPLAILAVFAVIGAGFPWWPALENLLSYGAPGAARAGAIGAVEHRAHELHGLATVIASAAALCGAALAFGVYGAVVLRAEDAARQFPGIYRLLVNKWYFDELYRYLLVRPAMIVSRACVWIDKNIIDWLIDSSAVTTIATARENGRFDLGVVDGLVNLVGNAAWGGGTSLHRVQTGWLRGYVLYIAVGVVALFAVGSLLFS